MIVWIVLISLGTLYCWLAWPEDDTPERVEYTFDDEDLAAIDYFQSLPNYTAEETKLETLTADGWVKGTGTE